MTGNWNDHIDPELKKKIKVLDDQVVSSFYENEPANLFPQLSQECRAG
jgi:hypothetical protein